MALTLHGTFYTKNLTLMYISLFFILGPYLYFGPLSNTLCHVCDLYNFDMNINFSQRMTLVSTWSIQFVAVLSKNDCLYKIYIHVS